MRRPVAAALCLIVLVAACRTEPSATAPADGVRAGTPLASAPLAGGRLRYAIGQPAGVTPADAADPNTALVVDALFDSLTAYDEQMRVVDAAAVRWSSPDARVWTFRLRAGATFHDGQPVTAGDFRFAWQLVRRAPSRHLLGNVAEVVDLSPTVLQVRLSTPDADFPAAAGHPALAPVPARTWRADPSSYRSRPIGNGPFSAGQGWAVGQALRLSRFADWRNGPQPALLDDVVFLVTDPETAYVAFGQGRVDVASLPPGAFPQAVEAYGRSPDGYHGPGVLDGATPVLYFVGFDTRHPPFNDPDARRAVSLSLDRRALAQRVLDGAVAPARSVAAASLPGAQPQTCPSCDFDPELARRLFAERGITHLRLWFNAGGGHEPVARALRGGLAAAGVEVRPRRVGFPAFLGAVRSGEADLFRFGWAADHATLGDALYEVLRSGGAGNPGGYSAPDVDALLERARATKDSARRTVLYQRAEELAVSRDQAIAPLLFHRHRTVVSDRAAGFMLDQLGGANLEVVSVRRG